MEMKKILCCLDFSEMSPKLAHYANFFAHKFKARLYYLYVSPSMTQYVGMHVPEVTVSKFVKEIEENAAKIMDEFIEKHSPDVETQGLIRSGYPVTEIMKIAHERQVDMIIMGTHGRKGMDKIVFGSVAEKVIKSSEIPVLTIRP
ncbi:MAG: universal stress protein [Desulfonatronovibrionaceae bacterium]